MIIVRVTRSIAFASLPMLAGAVLAGCGGSSEQSPAPVSQRAILATQQSNERQLPVTAELTLIKQGKPPLVHMAEAAAELAFRDVTTGVELNRVRVGPRQIVRFDARRGVMVGDAVVYPGPLAADHLYGIVLVPPGANTLDTHLVGPQAAPRATRAPRVVENPPATSTSR